MERCRLPGVGCCGEVDGDVSPGVCGTLVVGGRAETGCWCRSIGCCRVGCCCCGSGCCGDVPPGMCGTLVMSDMGGNGVSVPGCRLPSGLVMLRRFGLLRKAGAETYRWARRVAGRVRYFSDGRHGRKQDGWTARSRQPSKYRSVGKNIKQKSRLFGRLFVVAESA